MVNSNPSDLQLEGDALASGNSAGIPKTSRSCSFGKMRETSHAERRAALPKALLAIRCCSFFLPLAVAVNLSTHGYLGSALF